MAGRLLWLGAIALLATIFLLPSDAQCQSAEDNPSSQSVPDSPPQTRIFIVGLEFRDYGPLSHATRVRLAGEIRRSSILVSAAQPDSAWVNEALLPIDNALKEQGYFTTYAKGTPHLVSSQDDEKSYTVTVSIETGPLCHLGKMRFVNADPDAPPLVFSEDVLRRQFAMKEGVTFKVSNVRRGIESVRELYATRGYIDATL